MTWNAHMSFLEHLGQSFSEDLVEPVAVVGIFKHAVEVCGIFGHLAQVQEGLSNMVVWTTGARQRAG